MTVSELCHRLDCLTSELRHDGLVVIKQPDVFSQARMTRFRNDFENQMSSDLGTFHLVLSARINRLDSATTTQTTALGAALSAPGTTNVIPPPASASDVLGTTNNLFKGGPSLFSDQTPVQSQGPFGNLSTVNSSNASATAALGLGVDPTVYLDEKKRFLDHLNEIRRINLGPDQNDSSGYGLYLIRLPVSITPGESTFQGYGAELSVSVEHEFTPDFLPSAFRNLVINDIVDQLGPFVYEIVRSGFYEKFLKPRRESMIKRNQFQLQKTQLINSLLNTLGRKVSNARLAAASPHGGTAASKPDEIAIGLANFILQRSRPMKHGSAEDLSARKTTVDRLTSMIERWADLKTKSGATDAFVSQGLHDFKAKINAIEHGEAMDASVPAEVRQFTGEIVKLCLAEPTNDRSHPGAIDLKKPDYGALNPLISSLYKTALPDDVKVLDDLMGLSVRERDAYSIPLAGINQILDYVTNVEMAPFDQQIDAQYRMHNKIALPSVQTAKQFYPIAPRELKDFFLEENLESLAQDAQESSRTKTIRSNEVRDYLRHTLATAYYAMSYPTQRTPDILPPLANQDFMNRLLEALHERDFATGRLRQTSRLQQLYNELVYTLALSRDNIKGKPIAALCWAIAVDATLLDSSLKYDARKVFSAKSLPVDMLESVHFYFPDQIPNDDSKAVFCEYVKNRWPIVTFSLDPVTDQQNIADSFNLKRDLQLALSFAFATGQINFSQLSTFRRQIEQSSDTIALNRTVTAFAHGSDVFGFRFTPRFQNPPDQRTNIGVIASQLISGGPGPNYQIRKSKLESGIRELTAVALLPTFLPTMRMNVAGNWFKLTDPEHLVFHTGRMMEQGRRVQELRQGVTEACNSHRYRDSDVRVLRSKLGQLEAMLPMQSKVIQLPFENSASGFDLFSDGATALVPELTGFSGVDVIRPPSAPSVSTPATASSTPPAKGATATPAPSPGLTVTSTITTPTNVQSVSVVGGSGSIADVFVFGKYISLLDTKVVAGSRSAAFEVLSREVVHVQIPANVIPTTIENVDGDQKYVEIYIATPSGISNSILVPYEEGKTSLPKPVAYDVATASQSVNVFYQWLTGPDQRTSLVASAPPDFKDIAINWDSDTGIGPKQIQVYFVGTVNGQNVILTLPAKADNKGDFSIAAPLFVNTLLTRLEDITAASTLLPASISFSVSVQPFLPTEDEGLRVRTEAKPLKSNVTVNLQYNATGINALPKGAAGVYLTPAPNRTNALATRFPAMDNSTGNQNLAGPRTGNDLALVRVSQDVGSLPSFLKAPQATPSLDKPPLLAPNITSEAEQVARLLTGQPLPANIPVPNPLTTSPVNPAQGATMNVAAATTTMAGLPSSAQAPRIIVTPSPVIVVSPPATDTKKKQSKSRLHKMMNSIGNRLSQAAPDR